LRRLGQALGSALRCGAFFDGAPREGRVLPVAPAVPSTSGAAPVSGSLPTLSALYAVNVRRSFENWPSPDVDGIRIEVNVGSGREFCLLRR